MCLACAVSPSGLRGHCEKTKLSVGQEITVNVILPTSFGAWCEYQGLEHLYSQARVYYGDVSPAELLKPGYAYNVKIVRSAT